MSASGFSPSFVATSLEYTPSEDDLAAVRSSFLEFLPLPLELVDQILDTAEYWPSLSASRNINTVVSNNGTCCYIVTPPFPAPRDVVSTAKPDGSAARTLDTDKPMPILRRSTRRIRIKIRSHDQGWGGEPGDRGTYNGSWTWFEAVVIDPSIASSLERYTSNLSRPNSGTHSDSRDLSHAEPFIFSSNDFSMIKSASSPKRTKRSHSPPRHWHIQDNITSRSTWKDHTIIWDAHDDLDVDENSNATARSTDSDDGNQNSTKLKVDQWKNYFEWKGRVNRGYEVVQSLKSGDRLAVIARAQFRGWKNHVSAVSVEVFYFGW